MITLEQIATRETAVATKIAEDAARSAEALAAMQAREAAGKARPQSWGA